MTLPLILIIDMQPMFLDSLGQERALSLVKNQLSILSNRNMYGCQKVLIETVEGGESHKDLAIRFSSGKETFAKQGDSAGSSKEFDNFLSNVNSSEAILCGVNRDVCVKETYNYLINRGLNVHISGDLIDDSIYKKQNLAKPRWFKSTRGIYFLLIPCGLATGIKL